MATHKTKKKPATTRKPSAAKAASPVLNKSEFIRQRADKKAAEIVAQAKALGVSMTVGFVHTVRANARRKVAAASGAPAARRGRPAASAPAPTGSNSEAQFKSLVLRIGLDRASALLRQIENT